MRGFQKPPPGSRLDLSHPSAAGLMGDWLLSDAVGGDVVGQNAFFADLSPYHNPLVTGLPSGHAPGEFYRQGSANYGAGVFSSGTTFTAPSYSSQHIGVGKFSAVTFMLACNLAASQPNSFAGLLELGPVGSAGTGSVAAMNINGTTLTPSFSWSGASGQFGTSGPAIPAATDTIIAVTYDTATGKWASYVKGATPVTGTGLVEAAYDIAANSAQWALGRDPRFGESRKVTGTLYWARVWGRVLPPSEIASFFARPYQMVAEPITRRYWLFGLPSSGGTTALSGASLAVGNTGGTPLLSRPLAALADSQGAGQATLLLSRNLSALADSHGTGGGVTQITRLLQQAALAPAQALGTPLLTRLFAAQANAEAWGQGTALITRLLTTQAAAQGAGQGDPLLSRLIVVLAAAQGVGQGNPLLTRLLAAQANMQGLGQGAPQGSGAYLVAQALMLGVAQGAPLLDRLLVARAVGAGAAQGSPLLLRALSGAAEGVGRGQGIPDLTRLLEGLSASTGAAGGIPDLTRVLTSHALTQGSGEGRPYLIVSLLEAAQALGGGLGQIHLDRQLQALAQALGLGVAIEGWWRGGTLPLRLLKALMPPSLTPIRAVVPKTTYSLTRVTSMTPQVICYAGDDITVPFQILQEDGVTPQDITGWTVSLIVKTHSYDDDAFAAISLLGTPFNAQQGVVQFPVTSAQTAPLNGPYTFLLHTVDRQGVHKTPLAGQFMVKRG